MSAAPAPAETFPRPALIAVGGLLALTIAATAAVRLLGGPMASPVMAGPAVASIDLRFADEADGSVAVFNASSGAAVASLAPNTNGFVRGVMRGLARDRIARHIGAAPPFRLTLDRAGKLRLQDLATGKRIQLEAFGEQNRASFAIFLPPDAVRTRSVRS